MTKKVLVTGGLGYIGSHTVVALYEAGFKPIIVDDLSNSDIYTLECLKKLVNEYATFYECDLKDYNKLETIFRQEDFESVIHFAASKAVGESVEKPLKYYRNNLLSTINLMDLMAEFSRYNLIFSSSCTVYGEPDILPVTENTPTKSATSPYGNTKQICEEIIGDKVLTDKNFKAISLRYFNPIGAHSSGIIGEIAQDRPNNLLPYLLKVVSGELQDLMIFGDDYDTPDGTCIRDYIHVVDLAKAHVSALGRLEIYANESPYEVFNIGTGKGHSVMEIVKNFERVNNLKVNYKVVSRRDGDIEKIYADVSKAHQQLGWKAELDIEDMLISAWSWQMHLNQSKYQKSD